MLNSSDKRDAATKAHLERFEAAASNIEGRPGRQGSGGCPMPV